MTESPSTPVADVPASEAILPAPESLEAPEFWRTYSPRFEFPISIVGSIFLVACLFALIAAVIYYAMTRTENRKPVPMMGVDGGFDDFGEGSMGGQSGVENPTTIGDLAPSKQDYERLPEFAPLADVKDDIQKKLQIEDPNSTIPISDNKAREFAALSDALRGKMMGTPQGTGNGMGTGSESGNGKGGTGANSSRARSLRWTLSFKVIDGRDYVNQLAAISAKILIPLPDGKQALIFHDLRNPKSAIMTEKDWEETNYHVRFCDVKKDSVASVASVLNLNFTPHSFWVVFPKGLEKELADKEIAYQNRKPEDIEETKFLFTMRDGKPTIQVYSQTLVKR